jgi:hypothetical protein
MYQCYDLGQISVVVENPMTDRCCTCVLGSCTDKCSHHKGTSEHRIRKHVFENDGSTKEGERFHNYISYEPTLIHELELP